ncbi:hypothetical protein [Sporisorium scitamineum]|uniref:Uncharacterized protein n=1 Tax=Sporisorium scitamineum TaxID=49012 RepID=A0A0F7S4N3_9BASI|nr:hypothetical protein [Sporisorium scitamineum]
MQATQPQRPRRSQLRSQSPALERLSKMNAATARVASASNASSLSSPSPSHPSSISTSASALADSSSIIHITGSSTRPAATIERTDSSYPTNSSFPSQVSVERSQIPSSSARRPSLTPSNTSLSDTEGYSAFFDDYYTTQGPFETTRTESVVHLTAYKFPRSFGMNLDALTRSSAAHYAYNAEGYSDPNVEYGAKAVDDAHQATTIQDSYAQLISRLSLAHDGAAIHEEPRRNHPRSYEQSPYYGERPAPKTLSSKGSPFAASVASASSSSDAHDDELRTPPEPSFDGFEPSVDEAKYQSSRRPSAPASAQSPLQAQTPPSASKPPQLGSPFQPAQHQTQQSWQPGDRVDAHALFGRYHNGNSSELELLSDNVTAQRAAAGKGKMTPRHSPPQSSLGHERRTSSSAYAIVESSKPFTRLGPQDVVFSASTL